MTASIGPKVELSPLNRADGSATYSYGGYTLVGAVNGPIEVLRRDELPEEAALDVIVRPAAGVGGTRERHLESLVQSTLRPIILVQNHPRTLIQITLQTVTAPPGLDASSPSSQSASTLPILPALLQTSLLALLSASISLSKILTSTLVAVEPSGQLIANPSVVVQAAATSIHVFAFSSHHELLLAESEGAFDLDTWEAAHDLGERTCHRPSDSSEDEDEEMANDEVETVEMSLRGSIEQKIARDQRWKEDLRVPAPADELKG